MSKEKIEMSVELNGQEVVAYPYVNSDHVLLDNNMTIDKMLESDVVEPVITHEEVSFKVGQGDSDLSDSIVDSSAGGFTIKGQTYQNILPEPSTHVLSNNKEMFKVNEGLDSNVEIVDGVSKSAILSGNTLVNIPTTYNRNPSSNGNIMVETTNLSMLKSNTKYLLKIINKSNYDITYYPNASSFIGNDFTVNGKSEGYVILTSLDTTLTHNGIVRLRSSSETIIDLECAILFIEYKDGMENWDIPYFEGMQSVKMPVLTACGKNLFNMNRPYDNLTNNQATVVQDTDQITVSSAESGIYVNANFILDKDFFAGKTVTGSCLYESDEKGIGTVQITYQDGNGDHHYQWIKTPRTFTFPNSFIGDVMLSISANNIGTPQSNTVTVKNIQLELGSTATTYEPHKSNTLSTPEDLELRGIGDVKDELNLLTGELTQRIGEFVVNGTENWKFSTILSDTTAMFSLEGAFNSLTRYPEGFITDSAYPKRDVFGSERDYEGIELSTTNPRTIFIKVKKSSLNGWDESLSPVQKADLFKSLLSQNPITFQYQLAQELIKTVDLSSSGNWEKVVLNGSENWSMTSESSNNNAFFRGSNTVPNNVKVNSNNLAQKVICDILTPFTQDQICNKPNNIYGISLGWNDSNLCVRHKDFPLTNEGLTQWKQYLSQNPITVWYQTTNHKDSTQVKQPIFFKDGHIQLSSGADHSLIPTLDYEAKTSNSYVMDLMKTNTKYTMKAKSASGTFTIDGTSYGAGTNGTFTTPTSMTNKLLVMSDTAHEEVMILEGDVTDKTIPYFKGIKSAFEDEDKIEVLSTGKNLFDMNRRYDKITNAQATVVQNVDEITISSIEDGAYVNVNFVLDKNFFKGKTVVGSCLYESDEKGIGTVQINYQDTTGKKYYQSIKTSKTFTFPDEFVGEVLLCVYANNTNTPQSNTVTVKNIQLELGTKSTTYDSHKSNNTKIPLLSPLRSLPNGVCDELIIDRMKKKATLIQRVEAIPVTSVDDIRLQANLGRYNRFFIHKRQTTHPTFSVSSTGSQLSNWCPHHAGFTTDSYHFYVDGMGDIMLFDKSETLNSIRTKMSQSPFVALHQLATPIVTEIDLEGFPYIYKDGHIFLNSEIAPTTTIKYSINQAQVIQSQNSDIIRHSKEITNLHRLISEYVQVQYESTLLNLKVKMRA